VQARWWRWRWEQADEVLLGGKMEAVHARHHSLIIVGNSGVARAAAAPTTACISTYPCRLDSGAGDGRSLTKWCWESKW
jgi:hypothetical protein